MEHGLLHRSILCVVCLILSVHTKFDLNPAYLEEAASNSDCCYGINIQWLNLDDNFSGDNLIE